MTRCNRCEWQPAHDEAVPARDQLRAHALDSGHALCTVCGRSLSQYDPAIACERDLTTAREHLSGIVTLWLELPRHLGTLTGNSSGPGGEEHALPGGTVLALLAPGGTGTAARRLTTSDLQRGAEGREHAVDNAPDDTPSVAWSLASWEDDWRHQRGEPAAVVPGGTSAVTRAASRYLEVHARWAANQHEAFAEFAEDMRALHLRLEQATGRHRAPTKAGASCFDCGGDLVRRVTDGGLEEDHVTCTRCGVQYDQARYLLALAGRREEGLSGWVTVAAAAAASGRSEKTLRPWVQDGQVPAACRVEDRRVLVWYPAVHERTRGAQRRRMSA